jgi:MFS family permease
MTDNRVASDFGTVGQGGKGGLTHWYASSMTLSLPQAAGPVAFSFVALSLTGNAAGGAAMILAMTLAQIIGAVPITRIGRRWPSASVLRVLVACRTVALALLTLCVQLEASILWLVALAGLAGIGNGAAYGYLRSLLSDLVPANRLPRALGIATTLNEVTYVLAPVGASALGSVSPVLAILVISIVSAAPALLIARGEAVGSEPIEDVRAALFSPVLALWLSCAAVGGATVAAVEIGAVSLALNFAYKPAHAVLFTLPLCLASIAGGIWISWRNRVATERSVLLQLSTMALGSSLVAWSDSIFLAVTGTVLIGLALAPLGTYFALNMERLAPAHKRPEIFALLRTANAVGVIFASGALTLLSLSSALIVVSSMMVMTTCLVAAATLAGLAGLAKPE